MLMSEDLRLQSAHINTSSWSLRSLRSKESLSTPSFLQQLIQGNTDGSPVFVTICEGNLQADSLHKRTVNVYRFHDMTSSCNIKSIQAHHSTLQGTRGPCEYFYNCSVDIAYLIHNHDHCPPASNQTDLPTAISSFLEGNIYIYFLMIESYFSAKKTRYKVGKHLLFFLISIWSRTLCDTSETTFKITWRSDMI